MSRRFGEATQGGRWAKDPTETPRHSEPACSSSWQALYLTGALYHTLPPDGLWRKSQLKQEAPLAGSPGLQGEEGRRNGVPAARVLYGNLPPRRQRCRGVDRGARRRVTRTRPPGLLFCAAHARLRRGGWTRLSDAVAPAAHANPLSPDASARQPAKSQRHHQTALARPRAFAVRDRLDGD